VEPEPGHVGERWLGAAGRLFVALGTLLMLFAGAALREPSSLPLRDGTTRWPPTPRLLLLLGCGAFLLVCGAALLLTASRLSNWADAQRGLAYAVLAAVAFVTLLASAVAAVTFVRLFPWEWGAVLLVVLVGVALWRGGGPPHRGTTDSPR
jgi:hypothetical protein